MGGILSGFVRTGRHIKYIRKQSIGATVWRKKEVYMALVEANSKVTVVNRFKQTVFRSPWLLLVCSLFWAKLIRF